MKTKYITLIASFTFLFSCKTYTSIETPPSGLSVPDYCNTEYLGTITLHEEKRMGQSGVSMVVPPKSDLTIYNAIEVARTQYGDDVTIANIQWDYMESRLFFRSSRKVGMTFDVIRCY